MIHLTAWTIILSQIALTIAIPIHALKFFSGGTGMNIGHFPCSSWRTGETGVCIFSFTCVKSNGTALGMCFGVFYFGSCCKLNNDVSDIHPQENGIDHASSSSTITDNDHLVTTARPVTLENSTSIAIITAGSTTATPTTSTILSTIATVTTASSLPVPMEILNMSDYKQVCGRRLYRQPRIIGGARSSFGRWPWQISLRQWRGSAYIHKCGAVLLNEIWAITAAHCVIGVQWSHLMLRFGQRDLTDEHEPYRFQQRRVQFIVAHSQYDPLTFQYDLALLRFYKPLRPFQPNILPICLPDDDDNYVGRTAYLTGWGRVFEDGPFPSVLREVSVPVVNNTLCEGMYKKAGYNAHIPNIFICAGFRKGGSDSCEGDSGGPMVIERPHDKRWILAGVITWAIGCARPNQPGINTRISEFREWIKQFIRM